MNNYYLPIGTVVKVKFIKELIVITKHNVKEFDYVGSTTFRDYYFNHSEIEYIDHDNPITKKFNEVGIAVLDELGIEEPMLTNLPDDLDEEDDEPLLGEELENLELDEMDEPEITNLEEEFFVEPHYTFDEDGITINE